MARAKAPAPKLKAESTVRQEEYRERKAKRDANERLRRLAAENDDQLYSVDDAANFLELSTTRVRGLIKAGHIPTQRVNVAGMKNPAMRISGNWLRQYKEKRDTLGVPSDKQRYYLIRVTADVAYEIAQQFGIEVKPRFGKTDEEKERAKQSALDRHDEPEAQFEASIDFDPEKAQEISDAFADKS